MPNAQFIEEKIILRVREMADDDSLPEDIDSLLSTRVGDLPLDSLDLLALAMKLEDDLGRKIDVEMLDEALSLRELADRLGSIAE